jgi:acyl-CoA synthetase (AMP-forming)/AMP-acid ligase II
VTTYNLATLFESVVDAVPDRVALVCGDRRLTYAELDERANRLANALRARGIGAGDHVGLQLYNSTNYVEGMLAAVKIRAVPININFRYVEGELRYLYDDADVVALIFSREFGPRVAKVAPEVPCLRLPIHVEDGSGGDLGGLESVEYEELVRGASSSRDFEPRSSDDLFIIYTGGTTGMPKGVMWRHEDLFFAGLGGGNPGGEPVKSPEEVASNARNRAPVGQLNVPPLIHGAAQLGTLIGFFWGNKSVLVPRFDPDRVWRVVEEEKVVTMSLVGDAIARPLAEVLDEKGASYDLSSLAVISSAGAVFSEAVKEQLRRHLPNVYLMDNFGSSETGFQGTGVAGSGSGTESGPRFTMNDRTAVLDEDHKRIEPGSGIVGRVAQRGHVPLGYYKDRERTGNRFLEIEGERWVLLGDQATVDADGTIVFLGRGSVCINSGGEKIFPEEVEAAIKSHPDVFDAVVVGVPDPRWGQRVAAVVQPRGGASLTLASVDAHCRTRVAGYKVPREVHVVERMTRSPSGKADYPWAQKLATSGEAKVD